MQNEHDDIFQTADFALAAALVADGFGLATLNRRNSRRALFVFERTQNLNEAVEKYWNNTLSVKPRTYFDSIKHLKARLYDQDAV